MSSNDALKSSRQHERAKHRNVILQDQTVLTHHHAFNIRKHASPSASLAPQPLCATSRNTHQRSGGIASTTTLGEGLVNASGRWASALRPMRDANESAHSVELRSRTDIVHVSSSAPSAAHRSKQHAHLAVSLCNNSIGTSAPRRSARVCRMDRCFIIPRLQRETNVGQHNHKSEANE